MRTTREYIRYPGAAAVLALTEDADVVLERQYGYPLAREFIEITAGKVSGTDGLLETARRELLEETGYIAGQWRRICTMHNAIGYSNEAIELFLARDLRLECSRPDPDECIEVLLVPLAKAIAMVNDGRITDVKTSIALLWAAAFSKEIEEQADRI